MIHFKHKTEKHEFKHLKTANNQALIKRMNENSHLHKCKTKERKMIAPTEMNMLWIEQYNEVLFHNSNFHERKTKRDSLSYKKWIFNSTFDGIICIKKEKNL